MDTEGKIEHSSSFGQLKEVAFRCEDKHLILIEFELELIHHFEVATGVLKRFADGSQPFVESAFSLHTFVSPVCRKTTFGNVVHTFGTYLYFYPFTFRPHNGSMQRLVSVTLWHTQPIAKAFRIWHVHVRHDGIYLPTFLLLLFIFRIENDADGKQIVHPFERAFLLLHLLIDGVDGFGTSLHVEFQAGIFQLLLDRLDKGSNVSVTRSLGFIQFFLDVVIDFGFCIF